MTQIDVIGMIYILFDILILILNGHGIFSKNRGI